MHQPPLVTLVAQSATHSVEAAMVPPPLAQRRAVAAQACSEAHRPYRQPRGSRGQPRQLQPLAGTATTQEGEAAA
jgi:hypothetical protein